MKNTDYSFALGHVPIIVGGGVPQRVRAVPTMVLSTLFLLAVVTFIPWAVPLFMPAATNEKK